jgi:eukaryotic-like serine/threonine-protein kinase
VLDFGLAKVGWTSADDRQNSPTLSIAATQAGVILGTAGYMSPEQTKGKSVDKRADIWAFGVVLYEMITGRRLFQGEDVTEVLASVVKDQPDLTQVPYQVRRLLGACLEKDPNKRLRDISDVWRLLDDEPTKVAETTPKTARMRGRRYAWIAGALLLLALIPANVIHWRETSPTADLVRFRLTPPEKYSSLQGPSLAVSPDGRKVAFQAADEDGVGHLFVRSLDSLDAKILADVQNAPFPFWSPDSRYVAFLDGLKLKKVAVSGGSTQNICDVPSTIVGGAWSPEGVIVLGNAAGSVARGLTKVSADGGVPSLLTSIDASKQEGAHVLPSFLPDGRHFVYVRFSQTSPEQGGTYIGSIDEPPERQSTTMLMSNHATVLFTPSISQNGTPDIGYLLYLRDSTLVAHPFDPANLKLAGEAIPVADPVGRSVNDAIGYFSVSQAGTLVYRSGNEAGNRISWLDREGKPTETVAESGNFAEINLSPDMHSVAMASGGAARRDIFVLDLVRKINSRFTFDAADDRSPVWSPDGKQIVFSSARGGAGDLYVKASNGATNEELLYKSAEPKTPNDWSNDGRFLLYTVTDPRTRNDIWYLPMTGERKPKPFVQTPAEEGIAQFSPDGRFVAYLSNESGTNEIYVRSFPDGNGKWQISKGGGVDPRWRRDGKEILYISSVRRRMMGVDITFFPTFTPGTPKVLFETPLVGAGTYSRNDAFSLSPDGKSLLAILPLQGSASPINVILNWHTLLKK